MQRKIYQLFSFLMITTILAACSTTNDVVSDRRIQKRKYNKGFFIDFDKKWGQNKSDEVASEGENTPKENNVSEKEEMITEATETALVPEVNENAILKDDAPVNKVDETLNPVASETAVAESDEIKETRKEKLKSLFENPTIGRKMDMKHLKRELKKTRTSSDSDIMLILLVILALILPPLAVIIVDGASTRFWIDLILWLIGLGLGWFLLGGTIGWLGGLIAIIYAVLIVLGII